MFKPVLSSNSLSVSHVVSIVGNIIVLVSPEYVELLRLNTTGERPLPNSVRVDRGDGFTVDGKSLLW